MEVVDLLQVLWWDPNDKEAVATKDLSKEAMRFALSTAVYTNTTLTSITFPGLFVDASYCQFYGEEIWPVLQRNILLPKLKKLQAVKPLRLRRALLATFLSRWTYEHDAFAGRRFNNTSVMWMFMSGNADIIARRAAAVAGSKRKQSDDVSAALVHVPPQSP